MAAKLKLLALTVVIAVIENCQGLSCPCWSELPNARCPGKPQPPSCPPGKQPVLDACGCCQVCSQGIDERCGGPWKTAGTCSEGLECQDKQTGTVVSTNSMNPFGMRIGACKSPKKTVETPNYPHRPTYPDQPTYPDTPTYPETPNYPPNPYYPPWTYYWGKERSAEDHGRSSEYVQRV
ncbi:uncharacterized protein LOC129262846 [Lytechinus pictus]|uniref:uncharacterized protein LOC129262846 n=1 Tax=Lytechinus pictus TaxID=7653 RepID=UPI0030BA2308